MTVRSTFGSAVLALAGLVRPIQERFGPGGPRVFAAELGLGFPASVDTHAAMVDASARAQQHLRAIPALAEELVAAADDTATVEKAVRLAAAVALAIEAVGAVGAAFRTAGAGSGIPAAELDAFATNFAARVLDHLLVSEAEARPGIGEALEFIGAIERTDVPAGDALHPAHIRRTLHLDQLTAFLGNPGAVLATRYGWGTPGFTGTVLFATLAKVLRGLGLPVIEDTAGATPVLDVVFAELSPRGDVTPSGLAVTVTNPVPALPLAEFDGGDWQVRIVATAPPPVGTELLLRADDGITVTLPENARFEGRLAVEVTAASRDGEPFVLLGEAGGSRLEARELSATAGVGLRWDPATGQAAGSAGLGGEVRGLKLVIDASKGDGFLGALLAGARLEAGFDLSFTVDSENGLRLGGSGGIEVQVPVHLELGPLELRTVYLAAGFADGHVPVELSAGFAASLGPIQAVVERMGVLVDLSFPDGGGNVGPAQLDFTFKPPTGVGLSVDAGIVAGGGFLYFDEARGEYAGALELAFAGFIDVKAIGLITTRMPDGGKGFSLLIVLAAEFGQAGIQLGFGFKLLGVGGILGLNRRMDLDALVEGVVTGSIQSVMFPKDVVANAPRIISDLRRFFPPEEGTFLVGPMAKIGWGTPTLVSVSLGLVIEVPPGNIAILGLLECVLPSEDVALLVLRVSFVGALEVDRSRLWFFAQLFDSRVLTMTIEGGMGLLVAWGDNPDFVLSVGGFHPAFTPPPLPFPVPPRISVDILNSPGRLIRVSGYFAVTSNTVQFGAKAELRLGFSDFGLEGHLGFDALFRFSPFSFVVEISAGVSLKAFGIGLFGIDLNFTLEGPAPWRAHGRGSISLLFFEISADFDISWGEERTTTLPPVAVLELLAAEVRKPEGWQTRLPAGGFNPMVTLRQLPPGNDLVLHPLGSLFVQQRAIPLGVRLDRVGAQRPSDGKRFTVTPPDGSGLVRRSVTADRFAMAQFQDMDDAAKLSRPAYEVQDAGLELVAAGGAIASPRVVRRSARYELHIIDNEAPSEVAAVRATAVRVVRPRRGPRLYSPPPAVFGQLLAGSSTARSPLSRQEAEQRQPFSAEETVRVPGSRYVVAYLRNNQQAFPPATASATTSSFRSAATAQDAMADWVHADPGLAGQLHVLRQAEVPGGALAEPGAWSAAGAPPVAVAEADAVRLNTGQVLVAGGADATGAVVAAATVFDPVTRTWATPAAPLATARRRHTAVRLGDGRVVVAGGLGADGAPMAGVEVFDPATGTWSSPAGGLATARSRHTAVPAGAGVLVAGGTGDRGAALASAELLDPATLAWTAVGAMTEARTGHVAVVLGTGKVLVVGGAVPTGAGERALGSCELYDPATKAWTPTGGLAVARKGHQATLLPDGRVLVTGGDAVPAVPYRVDSLASAEVYDPKTGVWKRVDDLPGGGRRGHRCVRTPRGAVVIGGVGRPRATAGYRDVLAFDPATGSWTATGALATGRWDFPAVDLSDGRVLVAGGRALTGPAAPGAAQHATTAETYLP
ncbi:DUF6603 domain-containing protein [Actinophytocola sp.]|uniref:DUF6603 domain-containing protein n=1 Tax=Actinophytocola sp. TaxID=1872138 RepID=UPI002D5B4657|nr:DUF6603 domain-containing protein [Actinophytocola sp.]HYQ65050.1 DUF6603 domain-containing protein [Actinophytocola sp.]